jgi:hypothetical protein
VQSGLKIYQADRHNLLHSSPHDLGVDLHMLIDAQVHPRSAKRAQVQICSEDWITEDWLSVTVTHTAAQRATLEQQEIAQSLNASFGHTHAHTNSHLRPSTSPNLLRLTTRCKRLPASAYLEQNTPMLPLSGSFPARYWSVLKTSVTVTSVQGRTHGCPSCRGYSSCSRGRCQSSDWS